MKDLFIFNTFTKKCRGYLQKKLQRNYIFLLELIHKSVFNQWMTVYDKFSHFECHNNPLNWNWMKWKSTLVKVFIEIINSISASKNWSLGRVIKKLALPWPLKIWFSKNHIYIQSRSYTLLKKAKSELHFRIFKSYTRK